MQTSCHPSPGPSRPRSQAILLRPTVPPSSCHAAFAAAQVALRGRQPHRRRLRDGGRALFQRERPSPPPPFPFLCGIGSMAQDRRALQIVCRCRCGRSTHCPRHHSGRIQPAAASAATSTWKGGILRCASLLEERKVLRAPSDGRSVWMILIANACLFLLP
eukprot:SAG31_NODE_3270_length_4477_cov_2.498401_2_plen_161_part_00